MSARALFLACAAATAACGRTYAVDVADPTTTTTRTAATTTRTSGDDVTSPFEPPMLLSRTGWGAEDTLAYTPAVQQWADGAEKRRWIRLPPGARIDMRDVDHWSFPVGTRVWQEISIGGRRVETRMIERHGTGPRDFTYAAYAWNEAGTDAELVTSAASPFGRENVLGTGHDVPTLGACAACHDKEPERILGFSAIELAPHAPGDDTTARALVWLHANCGYCHDEGSSLKLRLRVGDADVQRTAAYRTAVGVQADDATPSAVRRVEPGRPEASVLHEHVTGRAGARRMARLGLRGSDPRGVAAVDAWIASLR